MAGTQLVHAAMDDLDFKDHSLTHEERRWASGKFARDWNRYKGQQDYWWALLRAIATIGVTGDSSAVPTLREILESDAGDRTAYFAINAVTRQEDVTSRT